MLKNGTCDCYENIKIKLWSSISILKPWHRNFSLQKENDCKFQLRFVKCCTLVVTEGYHILLSPLNRLVTCHFIMYRMYIIRTSWEHYQQKRKCSEGLSPSEGDLGGGVPIQKFLGSKEYLDLFNNTGKTLSYSI